MAGKPDLFANLNKTGGVVSEPEGDDDGFEAVGRKAAEDNGGSESEGVSDESFLDMIGKAETETKAPLPVMNELQMLKDKAKLMGLTYSPNIGAEALAAKIQAVLDAAKEENADPLDGDDDDDGESGQDGSIDVVTMSEIEHQQAVRDAKRAMQAPMRQDGASMSIAKQFQNKAVKASSVRQKLLLDAKKLIRCRVTNLDPKKKDLHGEIITITNGVIGTVRRFIPFGEKTENGWMMENIIYKHLNKKKFLQVRVRMVKGREVVESKWVKEYALEVLPQLTPEELARLATAQMAAGSLEAQN